MPELVLRLVQLGFLVLLWLFVLAAVRAVRADLFGPRSRPATALRNPLATQQPAPKSRRQERERTRRKPDRNRPSRLVVVEGSLRGTTVELGTSPVTIGRAEGATLVIADDYASNRHARFTPDGNGGWVLEDLGSTNGTYLDRTKVTEPTPVSAGVPIRIGRTVLELRP